jgi:hypothetical protein
VRSSAVRNPAVLRSLALRARVALHRARLDRSLVAGVDGRCSPELGLRAEQLTRPAVRARLASALDLVLGRAATGGPQFSAGPRLRRREVLASAPVLRSLAARLRSADPPHAAGVLLTRRLIVDGLGPLYVPAPPGALWDQAQSALIALETPPLGERALP